MKRMTRTPSGLAVPELAEITVHGHTRAAFLTRAALAAGAVAGMGAISPFTQRALAQSAGGDVEILNFALTLEHLEAGFYERALADVSGLDGELRELAQQLQEDETAHVDTLTSTIEDLGGTPVEAPGLDFGEAFASVEDFLKLANTLEDTGVSAYNGAAPMIESTEILAAAGSIVQIEARHAALIRLRRDEPPAPQDFDESSTVDEVTEAITPLLASG